MSLCAALDMVQSTVASVQPGLGTDVWQGLPGWGWAHGAVLLDPPPGWRHLTAPRLTGGSGIDAVAAGSWTALVSPIFERDLSLQGGSITPFGAGASSPAREAPSEQLKGFVKYLAMTTTCLWPVRGLGPCARGCLGWGAWGHHRECPHVPVGSCPARQILSEILHKCLGAAVRAQPLLGDLQK